MKTLKDFEKLPTGEKLKKEFNFDGLDDLHVINTIKRNLNEGIKYTAGEQPKSPNRAIYFDTREELELLFGLPYTSSGDFAGLWVTNTQAETDFTPKKLTFQGGAITETRKAVLVFDDEEGKTFYFVENDFADYRKQEKRRLQAIQAENDTKNARKLVALVVDILKANDGKKYGEKTRQEIGKEIYNLAHSLKLSAWLSVSSNFSGGYYCSLNIDGKIKKFYLNFDFLTDDNKIQAPKDFSQIEEINGKKIFTEQEKLAEKIKEQAKKLLPLLEKYNNNNIKIGKDNKDTQTMTANVWALAKYEIEY